MSRSAIDIMALQPNARAIIDMVDEVSDIGTGRTELKSWRSFSCTTAEYAQVYHYLRQPGKEDLYDCFNTIRVDRMPRLSHLFVRLPSQTQSIFTRSVQTALISLIHSVSRMGAEGWLLSFIRSFNGDRDVTSETALGEHRPDLKFLFQAVGLRGGRKRARTSTDPSLVVEICNDYKHGDMASLAEMYMRHGDGAVRTVVAIDPTSGTYSVWRYLRYLPTKLEGKEYRKCFQTEKEVVWRGDDAQDLVLKIRDFLPTRMPIVEGMGDEALEVLMKKPVVLKASRLADMWDAAKRAADYFAWVNIEVSDDETEMDLSDTEADIDPDNIGTLADLDDEDDDDEQVWEDTDEDVEEDSDDSDDDEGDWVF